MSRGLKILLLVLAVAGVGFLSVPWWLGAVLRPVLNARGVAFDRYERAGYAHFRLTGVRYAKARIEFTAGQVTAPTPLVWLGQRLRGTQPTLTASNWQLRRRDDPNPPATDKTSGGLLELQATLQRVGPRVVYWLPRAHLSAGEVRGFGPDLAIAEADWRDATLKVEGLRVADQVIALTLAPYADGAVSLAAHTMDNEAGLQLVWSGANLKGEAVWSEQTAQLSARFPDQGWLPAEASITAENWQLPAARVKLGAPYARVSGSGRLLWRDNAFDLSLDARAEPGPDAKAPKLEGRATARGNLREVTVTALHVTAPFATADLSAPITFSLDRPPAGESARLSVQADLAKMPWFEAKGRAEGTVTVAAGNAAVRQEFALTLAGIAVKDFAVKTAQARGVLHWPRMELAELKVQLDDSSSFEARGALNWQTRELDGVTVQAKLAPASLAAWLPAGATWTTAELTATADGPLAATRHRGELKLGAAQWPPLKPVAIEASWQGTGRTLDFAAKAQAAESMLEFAGAVDPRALQLRKLQFAPDGKSVWQLAAPAQVTWSPAWRVDNLRLAGPDSQLTFKGQGGPEGFVELAATKFDSRWLQAWVPVAGPAWQVHTLQISGRVERAIFVFAFTLSAQIDMAPHAAQVTLRARGNAQGVQLEELKVEENGHMLTQATGRLPVVLATQPNLHPVLGENAPLELTAATEPDSPLWATLSAQTGFELTRPSARINLKGTLRQPAGEVNINVARLAAVAGRFKLPPPDLEELALAAKFDRDRVTITTFSARLDGQAVQASGQLPMDDGRWRQLWQKPGAFDWSKAEAHVDVPDADLGVLARRFPQFIAGQGRLRARVELAPGERLTGELHLTDAATRPLGSLGALRDVHAELALDGRVITVRKLAGSLGGEPVSLDGTVTLTPGGAPRLALGLKGKNLPLVRNTGLLLRSDLDLRAETGDDGLTRLSGAINVRDCLVLTNVNLRSLLPTGRRGVTRQPPYFAVESEFFKDWSLAVAIRAPGAIRVRTAAYSGTASASFQLDGTLGEPRAVGELTVDRGQVLFPFATFQVQQGSVRLREADPFHAVVSLNATSQRRDYQLRLEMNGELPSPNITITSTPALDAADVLLMVMTGQPPAGEVAGTATSGPRLALLGAYLSRGFLQNLGFSGEERLEISAGEHVSRQGRETYEFEYKLGEHWSLQGEYDEFDAYNAGVKWRVYTEEGTPREKK